MAAFFNNKMAIFTSTEPLKAPLLQYYCSTKMWVIIPPFAIFSINIY